MYKLKKWISRLSIRKKIIFYSYAAIIPILLLICGGLWLKNYEDQKEMQIEQNVNMLQSVEDNFEIARTEIIDMANYISVNQDINAILKTSEPEELNRDTRLWAHQASIQMIEDMAALKGSIKTIAIYPENGIRPYFHCIDSSTFFPEIELIKNTDAYRQAVKARGYVIWKYMEKGANDIYLETRSNKIVLCRELYDTRKQNKLGYLVIGASEDNFRMLCSHVRQDAREAVIILTHDGEELVRVGGIDEKVQEYIQSEEFLSQNYKERKQFVECGSYTVFSRQTGLNGEIICKIVPQISMAETFKDVAYMPVFLMLGVLAGLLPVLLFMSNIVCRPLEKVCIGMDLFKQGDFSQQVDVDTEDEIGEVSSCFNKMVTDMKELIDRNYVMALRERESEIAALQAQINPHFLYNTLDSLYWQASGTGDEEMAENIYALSQLFRLVLGQGKGFLTVRDEMELNYRYLEIQKMRFLKQMDFDIDIEEGIQEFRVPKLLLQPFVENAVVHGSENSKDFCMIRITGRMIGDKIEFRIQDTGVGMSEEQVENIWKKDDAKAYSSQRLGGYAIRNVKERLELEYGNNFDLRIESQIGKGTTVILLIPTGE